MGQNQTKKQHEGEQSEHERLGLVKLEAKENDPHSQQEQDESYIMHLKRSVETENIYSKWLKSMNQINDTESKEVLLLPLKHSFESVGMCGSSGIAKLTYDYYEFVLKTEIANRQRLKKDFLETQVWYLLYNIVRAGSKFEHLKKKIGNIHPMNILINESGQIKIISTVSIPGELDNYEQLLQRQHDIVNNIFLAPEQINNDLIQKGQYPSHVDPSLAEVFCIGLTILSSGTLEDCDSVYKYGPWELRKDRLNSLLRTFREKYSDYLYETVASMLAINPQERRKCSSIASALYEYEPQILDLEPFAPSNYRPQQRPSYGYQPQPQYSQPPPQHISQPVYYQGPPVTMSQGPYSQAPVVRQTAPQQGHYSIPNQPMYVRRQA